MNYQNIILKQNFNSKGMSLIEIMVVLVIMSLIGLGTTNLLKNVIQTQRKTNIKGSLAQVRDNLKNTLNNDTAWNNTVGQYPAVSTSIGCLQDNVLEGNSCAHNQVTNELIVRDALDGEFYNSELATSGFTQLGQPCNAFNLGGNDLCPYRYNIDVTLRCPNETATCIKPKVIIDATFLARPADPSGPFGQVNDNELSFQIIRSERLRYEPLQINHQVSGNIEGGACIDGYLARPLTNIVNDVGNNVAGLSGNTYGLTNTFALQPGIYDCTITAQVYGVPSGFNVMLNSSALPNPIPIGNGFTSPYGSTVVTGKARFQTTGPANFQVTQNCPSITSWGSPVTDYTDNRNMGIPNPDYTSSTTYTEVNCVRTL